MKLLVQCYLMSNTVGHELIDLALPWHGLWYTKKMPSAPSCSLVLVHRHAHACVGCITAWFLLLGTASTQVHWTDRLP